MSQKYPDAFRALCGVMVLDRFEQQDTPSRSTCFIKETLPG